jgi:glycosyltransferase involved in cell wall biosynthesis
MHVAILPSESFLTSWAPLGGIFQMDLARALVDEGHTVGVIAVGKVPMRNVFSRGRYPSFETVEGVAIFRRYLRLPIPQRLDHSTWLGALYARTAARALALYIRNAGRPDVLHAHNVRYGGVVAKRLSEEFGIPFVVTEHSSEYAAGRVTGSRVSAFRDVWRSAAARSVVSSALASHIVRHLDVDHNRIDVIPNMLPRGFEDLWSLDMPRRGDGKFVLLNVAEFVPVKGHRLLLRAFASAFAGGNERLRLVGSGPLESELRAMVQQLGIGGQVSFRGRLSRNEIRDELRASDAFVLASNAETFGVVVIEALSQGVPIVTSACGGPEEIVQAGDGFVVPNHDVEALAEGMLRMRAEIVRFDRREISQRCAGRFASEAVARQYAAWYAGAVAGVACTA